jgi:putative membrane protein
MQAPERGQKVPIMRFLLKLVVVALAIALTAALVPGIDVDGGALSLLWIAVIFSLVNLLIKPIATLLSLPLILVTLGLFALVVNAAMLGLTAWLTTDLDIDGFFPALFGAIIISVVLWVAELVLTPRDARD